MPKLDFSRNPDTSDTLTTDFRLLSRRGLSNQINTFKSEFWPTTNTFRFTVSALSKTEVDSIINFLQTYAGQEITLIDYDSITWTGIVVEDPRIEQSGPGCQYRVTIALEGTFVFPES